LSRVEDEPGFADRWSRLKQEAKEPPAEAEPEVEVDDEAADDRTDAEVLEELGLPDPDTLKSGDNFAAFMAKAVPARIRNRALRKLWVSDPVFANLDMLIDYGEDFTDSAMVIENLQTAYQVGRGFIDKVAELAEDEEKAEQPEASVEEPVDEPVAEASELADAEEAGNFANRRGDFGAEPTPRPALQLDDDRPVPEPRVAARQRMRFRVAED
jgi:hypothetical protein